MGTTSKTRFGKHTNRPVPTTREDGLRVVTTSHAAGYSCLHTVSSAFWPPMFVMALTFWAAGFLIAIVEAGTSREDLDALQDVSNLVPAFMFVGFHAGLASISLAVALVLTELQRGDGKVQEAQGAEVQTLKLPGTAKAMLVLMMMGMMVMAVGIALNLAAAGEYGGEAQADIVDSAQLSTAAEGLRRIGVALYLTGIASGLAAIDTALQFQAIRSREITAGRRNR